jgi:hypothetical protein
VPTTPHPLNTSSHNTAARRPPHPSYTQHNTTHNNTQQHYTTALWNIKLPMYQLFLWRLYIMVLRGATSLLGAPHNDAPLKTIMYRAIKTTGTLIVIIISWKYNPVTIWSGF